MSLICCLSASGFNESAWFIRKGRSGPIDNFPLLTLSSDKWAVVYFLL